MTFEIVSTPTTTTKTSVIPLIPGDQLETVLTRIAEGADLPVKTLLRDFKADFCELLPIYTNNRKVYLLGLGNKTSMADLVRAFRILVHRHKDRLPAVLAVNCLHLPNQAPILRIAEAAANGLYLGTYRIGRFKTEPPESAEGWDKNAQVIIQVPEASSTTAAIAVERGHQMARTQSEIMDLVNAPSNKKIPADLANWAKRSGNTYGYRVETMDVHRIRNIGLHALLAVNQGSEHPPMFIVMEYRPKDAPKDLPKIGLVGKGVTFDTGGLSIKPSTNLHYMKSDMGGAGAVFGTMEMAAKLQLPVHLIGIVPATDNSVDAKAVKPSDVIDSYSGKTIEIIDTDAEGRLILADGIAYMLRHFQPEVLIDLATLTGSAVRTLGYHAAALFTKNDRLFAQLDEAAQETGERVWRFPLWEVYQEDIKSDVADIRNFSGKPIAGAIGAAKFLEFFTEDHPAWAHLDIAGVAFGDSEFSMQKSGTAYGVRLLTEYLLRLDKT